MGGAERAERRRRQQQAAAAASGAGSTVAAARRGPGPNRAVVAAAAVAALLAVVVGGGVWLQQRGDEELPATIPVAAAGPDVPVVVEGDGIVVGPASGAPVTIEVYEDFLCPVCAEFEETYGGRLVQAAADGVAQVRYYPVAILDERSQPEGYSTLAAGAAACAAEAGVFPRFHESLFAEQPEEGGAGWSAAQLEQLGRDLGAGDAVATCLDGGGPIDVAGATARAGDRLGALRPDRRFGTPTVLVDGVAADIGDDGWLDDALGTAG